MRSSWFSLLFFCFVGTHGCITSASMPYGLTGDPTFIPARTAVLPCRALPRTFRLSQVQVSAKQARDFCAKIDQFVLAGYKNQPYMGGYTPRLVRKLHSKTNYQNRQLQSIFDEVTRQCQHCKNIAEQYQANLAPSPIWLLELQKFSKATNLADAILMPILVEAEDLKYTNRGLLIHEKNLQFALLLISTQTGSIIWNGGNHIVRRHKILNNRNTVSAPSWETVLKDALIKAIWKDFPGRIAGPTKEKS